MTRSRAESSDDRNSGKGTQLDRTGRPISFVSGNLCSGLLMLIFLLTLMLPNTARGQGLEVGSGWVHSTGNNGADGFNFDAAWWFTKRVTVAADYDTAWDSTTLTTFTFSQFGGFATKAHLQNVLFGPRIFFSTRATDKHRVNPFGEAQFGLSHLNETITQQNGPTVSSSDTGFTWMLGGGAEYLFGSHWSGRVNVDLLRTHLANQGQSHLRFVLGIRYTFGSRERRSASSTPTRGEPPSTTDVLMGLEQRRADALQKADVNVLESILSDSYIDTNEMGHQTGKKAIIADLTSGDLKIKSMTLSGMQVYQYGSTATVTGRAIQDGVFKGQRLTDSIVFTDTFYMQNGVWKAVASHRTGSSTPALKRPPEEDIETPLSAGNKVDAARPENWSR